MVIVYLLTFNYTYRNFIFPISPRNSCFNLNLKKIKSENLEFLAVKVLNNFIYIPAITLARPLSISLYIRYDIGGNSWRHCENIFVRLCFYLSYIIAFLEENSNKMPTVILLDLSLSMTRPVLLPENCETTRKQLALTGIKTFLDTLSIHSKLEFIALVS